MEKILKKLKTNVLISSLLCVLLGLVLVFWPGLSIQIVCTAVGAVLMISGVVRIVSYVTARDGSMYFQVNLIFGIIFAVVGVWIVIKPAKVLAIIPIIVGIVIALHGLHNLQQAMDLCQSKYDKWWIALLLGILTIGFGILLICRPFAAIDTVVMLIGIFLIYDGLSNIWIVSRISRNAKILKQEAEAVEAEAREVEE
ncbi:MAG: hypothetical protein HFI62_07830 [Lachnospiraceae bacterium]|mgnify:FL=1|jgi:uncharacterized membrane protein HdeD (DUF308 family)|nr:hypothetical protein [Lachnospiraceae bacterium]